VTSPTPNRKDRPRTLHADIICGAGGRGKGLVDDESVTEVPAGQDVDDKVDGGVEEGQGVTDGRVVVVPVAAPPSLLVHHRPEDVVDERGRLTEEKDAHDDDEHD